MPDGRSNFFWWTLVVLVTLVSGCEPSGVRALLEGKRLIDQGKYPQAIGELRVATSESATNAQAWNYLGLAYHYAGQTAAAEHAYQRALQLDRDLTEAHYNLGCLWLEENRPDKLEGAKMELTSFTLRQSSSLEGWLRLGTAQLRSKESAAAEKSFGEALKLSAQNLEALNGLGMVRLQRGRTTEGVQYFYSALKHQPNYRPALLNLAIVTHQYTRDRAAALQKYREFLATAPAPAQALAVSGVVRQLEQELNPPVRPTATNAVVQAAPTPTNNSGGSTVAVTSAQTPLKASNPPPAVTAPAAAPARTVTSLAPVTVERAVLKPDQPVADPPSDSVVAPREPVREPVVPALSPQASAAHPLITTSAPPARVAATTANTPPSRGLLQRLNPMNLFRSSPTDSARTTSTTPGSNGDRGASAGAGGLGNSAVSSAPAIPRYAYLAPPRPAPGDRAGAEGPFAQGLQAYQQRRLAEAAKAFRQAIQADPSFFKAHYNLALAVADSGDLAGALTAYEIALAIEPESMDARYNFALVLKQAGYLLDAQSEFEKDLAAYPNDGRAHLALGNLYAQQFHQTAKARAQYLRALELDPHNPQANAVRFWLSANPAP